MNYDLLGRVMELVHLDDYYSETTAWQTRNSVYYALKHGKVLTHYSGDNLTGYCTYSFFTKEELESESWDGEVVYSRSGDGILYFPKFQCRAGRLEVIKFVKDIQEFMFKNYPDCVDGYGDRVYLNGNTRLGKWHRKAA